MKSKLIIVLAAAMYWSSFAMADDVQVPPECKNLALMAAQLLQTRFSNTEMGDKHNPGHLTLKTDNGLKIGKLEYLGGDGEDEKKQGTYPCDKDQTLCTNPAGAGGSIDWARVSIMTGDDKDASVAAEVVVSMGSRGGCSISSARVP